MASNVNTLRELNMSHNKISDKGIISISEALQSSRTLQVLNISDNNIYICRWNINHQ